MYLSPINYQSKVMENNINQKNQKVNAKNVDTVAFKGAKLALKTKDTGTIRKIMAASIAAGATALAAIKTKFYDAIGFNSAMQKRLEAMAMCDSYGEVPWYVAESEFKELIWTYIKNPKLAKQLMTSTLKDGRVTWAEYSTDAIDRIVNNNKLHPKKTELLKKCLSRSYEFWGGDYKIAYIVNKYPEEKIQEALKQAGYQENKVWNYPKNFYSPQMFVRKFEELYGKIDDKELFKF